MNEHEWFACTSLTPMLEHLREQASDRKLRLLAVGCCRNISDLFSDEQHFAKLVFAELLAERKDTRADRRRSSKLSRRGEPTAAWSALSSACEPSPYWAAINAAKHAAVAMSGIRSNLGWWRQQDVAAQASLVRELFGNPFRPVTANTTWLTSDVVALAEGVYTDRAFDRLPILADALQDAGCDDEDVLNHCRSEGPHVRGCWVLDLVLRKE